MIVNIPTQKDFKDLIRLYKILDYEVSVELSDWDIYKDQTCIKIDSGSINEYGKISFYKQKGERIYSFEEFRAILINGQIKEFPLEVVTAMLYHQKKQIGKVNLASFIVRKTSAVLGGGFDWDKTKQGFDYWNDIIDKKKFEDFNYNKSIL